MEQHRASEPDPHALGKAISTRTKIWSVVAMLEDLVNLQRKPAGTHKKIPRGSRLNTTEFRAGHRGWKGLSTVS